MAYAAFGHSTIANSNVTSDANNVTANNSPIGSMTVNYSYFYGGKYVSRSRGSQSLINLFFQTVKHEDHPQNIALTMHKRYICEERPVELIPQL